MDLSIRSNVNKKDALESDAEEVDKYVLIGTDEAEMVPLGEIPSPLEKLKSIYLKYVEIDPEILMRSLKDCKNLESLELIDVDFTFTPDDRSASFQYLPELQTSITLPKLKSYKLRTGLNTEIGDFNRKDIFAGWFPFNTPIAIEEIVKSNISVDIFGRDDGTIFLINHDHGEIQSKLRWTNDILKNLPSEFIWKKLVVFFCYAELDAQLFQQSLKHLELTGVEFKNGSLSDIFERSKNIETLYLDGVHNQKRSDDPGHISLDDLVKLSNLSALWLDHMNLKYTPGVKLSKLREIVLDSRMDNIDTQVIQNFDVIFPSLETVALVMNNELVNPILEKILRLQSIRNIFLKTNYIKEYSVNWSNAESEEVKNILLEINSEEEQYFTICKTSAVGKWSGAPVENYGPYLKEFLNAPFVAFWD